MVYLVCGFGAHSLPMLQLVASSLMVRASAQRSFSIWRSSRVITSCCCAVSFANHAALTRCAWIEPDTESGSRCEVTSGHLPVLAEVGEVTPQFATPRCRDG